MIHLLGFYLIQQQKLKKKKIRVGSFVSVVFILKHFLPKPQRFSFILGWLPAMWLWQHLMLRWWMVGLQLSPRQPSVNYCPSARHPRISSFPYLLLYSGYVTIAPCAREECETTGVTLQRVVPAWNTTCLIPAMCQNCSDDCLSLHLLTGYHSKYWKPTCPFCRKRHTCCMDDSFNLALCLIFMCLEFRMWVQT